MLRAFESKARLPSVPMLSTAIVVGPRAIAASLETPCIRMELNPDRRELLFSAQDTTRRCCVAPREVPSKLAPKPLVPRQTVAGALSLLSWISRVLAFHDTIRERNSLCKGDR